MEEKPENIKEKIENNPNRLAWKVKPSSSYYGYLVWYNSKGECMSAMTVKENKKAGWGSFENFDKSKAEYNPNTKSIVGEDNNIMLKLDKRSDKNLVREIKDNINRSEVLELENTTVGELYLQKMRK